MCVNTATAKDFLMAGSTARKSVRIFACGFELIQITGESARCLRPVLHPNNQDARPRLAGVSGELVDREEGFNGRETS